MPEASPSRFAAPAALIAGLAAAAAWAGGEIGFRLGRGARRRAISAPSASPAVSRLRALEPGRGREAVSPIEIPAAGWKDILLRTWREAADDRLISIAAGVVFFSILALFPATTALVSSYGLFVGATAIADHLSFLATILPAEAYSIMRDQIARVTAKGDVRLGAGFVVGLGLAIWSANAGVKAIIDALNVVYDEEEKRGFLTLNAVSLALTGGALIAAIAAAGAVIAVPVILASIGLGDVAETLVSLARWPLLALGMLFGLALLYRFGPSRREAKWRWLSVGAIVATALWLVGSAALSLYFSRFAHYDATYGSLAAIIATMMWMWMTAIVVLVGAELNAEIEHQTARDSTEGPPKPLGARGAAMADSVGESAGA